MPNGDNGVPLTAVVDKATAKANCSGVSGLAKILQAGCVGSVTWKTPRSLTPGTYTYFCRIHPFMRGSFRVVPKKTVKG
jgi:plastocyanin